MPQVLLGWILSLALYPYLSLAGMGEIRFSQVEHFLQDQGITEYYSDVGFSAVQSYLLTMKEEREQARQNEQLKDDAEDELEFIEYAQGISDEIETLNDPIKRDEYYLRIKHIIYSLIAPKFQPEKFPVFYYVKESIEGLITTLPHISVKNAKTQLISYAEKEAHYLVNPKNQTYVAQAELSQMTVEEAANLDIASDHPTWKSLAEASSMKDSWAEIEEAQVKAVTKDLKKKYEDLLPKDFKYNINVARKVLFYEGIKESNTNAKINVRDRLGVKWKMKWGAEGQSEPVANDLYLKAGAKIADLVYSSNVNNEKYILVFVSGEEENKKQLKELFCKNARNVYKFKECMMDSKFNFDVSPYIQSSGVFNQLNIKQVLGEDYFTLIDSFAPDALLGKNYVILNEASVEFKGSKLLKNGGISPSHNMGAEVDRVSRSNILFNMWIHNVDGSDLNNRNYLDKNPGGDKKIYLENQQDLGASMGSALKPALLNNFRVGNSFMGMLGGNIWYKEFILHRPRAWDVATPSDLLWMAQHLSRIKMTDIKAAVARSAWPDFMQEVYAARLYSRLNTLLSFYGLNKEKADDLKNMNISIDLSTHAKRKEVAKRYDIPLHEINEMLNVDSVETIINYNDQLVSNGNISSCSHSVIVNLLEKYRYPSGLSQRVVRYFDNKPLKACKFQR